MAHVRWRPGFLVTALVALAMPAAAVRAEEAPTDAPNAVCVTRALRIGAAEVNGTVRTCEDPVTHVVTTPPTLVFQTPPADSRPVSYTPPADGQGPNATSAPADGPLSNATNAPDDDQGPNATAAPDPQP